MRVAKLGVVAAALGVLGACDLVVAAMGYFSQLDLMGVVPAAGFSDPASPDYGKVTFALTARDDIGAALAPAVDELEIVSDGSHGVVHTDGGEEVPGAALGTFLLVADGSGSTEADVFCDGCPTDPERIRVEAVRQLAEELGRCGGWQMSLVEFGRDRYPGPVTNHVLADWTESSADVATAAEELSSGWTTPLWDAVVEGVERLDEEYLRTYTEKDGAGRGLVIVSDGVDTASRGTFDDAVAAATEIGLPVHTIGFGPASDADDDADDDAVEGLRRLAEATGGTYGYVSSVDELPALTTAMAGAMCGGYTTIDGRYDSPPPSGTPVSGFVRLKSRPEFGVPFLFRAP